MWPYIMGRGAKYYLGLAVLVLSFVFSLSTVLALDVPPVPTDIPVVDQTGTLSNEQKSSLAATIAAERAKSSNQIAVLMIPTLDGDSLEDYSIRVARTWGIGTKEHNNGVLLLIVKEDRKLRIEVGYGLEGALPDARASQIIRNRITPEFQQGRYFEGINAGLTGIIAAIHNEYDPALNPNSIDKAKGINWEAILYAVFVIPIWLSAILARSKSWWAGGIIGGLIGGAIGLFFGFFFIGLAAITLLVILGLLLDWVVSKNYRRRSSSGRSPSWWAGGTHLGGGSGGFGGFGGGGFGGGGSSGSW